MNYQHVITIEPGERGGRPCIRGIRTAVADVLDWLASGMSHEQIMSDFPEMTEDDIRGCLLYAAKSLTSLLDRHEMKLLMCKATAATASRPFSPVRSN